MKKFKTKIIGKDHVFDEYRIEDMWQVYLFIKGDKTRVFTIIAESRKIASDFVERLFPQKESEIVVYNYRDILRKKYSDTIGSILVQNGDA